MKSLKEMMGSCSLTKFILEEQENSEEQSKTFSFNFSGIDNFSETLKSLKEYASENNLKYEGTEESFDVTLTSSFCKENKSVVEKLLDIVKVFAEATSKDSKNASSESYAQLVSKLKNSANSLSSFIQDSNSENKEEE